VQATPPERVPAAGPDEAAPPDAALARAREITRRFRDSAQSGDVDGVLSTLAPEVVLRSPITDRVAFHGREQIGALMRLVFATARDIRYFADVGDAHTRALFDRSTVGGRELEQAIRVQLDERQRIVELTIFFRPLPGLTGFSAALVPRLAASKHGRLRALAARLLLAPLALATRAGDRLSGWLA
jgi:hypothetical protein